MSNPPPGDTGEQTAPAAHVAPGEGGAAAPTTLRVTPSDITARWEKEGVTPVHNTSWPPDMDAIPDEAKTQLLITTENIAAGTPATISVRRCDPDGEVPEGRIENLVVGEDGRVVDAEGEPPTFAFTATQQPYAGWDKPFFYFRVSVAGRSADSPRDYATAPSQCLRVYYWVQVIEHSVPDGRMERAELNLSLQGAAAERHVRHNVQYVNMVGDDADATRTAYGSLFRNAYAVHIVSHGDCFDEATHRSIHDFSEEDHANGGVIPPETVPPGDWHGCTDIHGQEVWFRSEDARRTPSAPAVLVFVNCCLTGYTDVFPKAFLDRGTRYVIAHRREASGGWCARLSNAFYTQWLEQGLDPSKVPDIFLDVSPPCYAQTWCTLYPLSATAGRGGGGGIDDGVLAAILVGVGVAVAAGAAVLIWGAATNFQF